LQKFGAEQVAELFYDAGNIAGRFFFEHFLKDYKDMPLDGFTNESKRVFKELGVGIVDLKKTDSELSFVAVKDLAAFGLSALGEDFHEYDEGFVTGIFAKYTGQDVSRAKGNWLEGRGDLGPNVNLIPYRMLQYTFRDVTEQQIGTEACDKLFYDAGDIAGKFFFDGFMKEFKDLPLNGFIAELQRLLKELGVGILRVEKADPENGEFTLTVSEDLDCSGLPDLGIEVCNYDEGFIAGIFFKYTGVTFKAKEVDCWCSGDRTCRFAVNRI
jgi:predicted hydrocarbon binding protein